MNGRKVKQLRKEYNKLYKDKEVLYNINSRVVENKTFRQFKKNK